MCFHAAFYLKYHIRINPHSINKAVGGYCTRGIRYQLVSDRLTVHIHRYLAIYIERGRIVGALFKLERISGLGVAWTQFLAESYISGCIASQVTPDISS